MSQENDPSLFCLALEMDCEDQQDYIGRLRDGGWVYVMNTSACIEVSRGHCLWGKDHWKPLLLQDSFPPWELKTKTPDTFFKCYSEKGKMILTNDIKIIVSIQLLQVDFKFDFS